MVRLTLGVLACCLIFTAALSGCGGGETEGASVAAPSADPGRPVSGTRQLSGGWYNPDPIDFAGVEFGGDGKVMVTFPGPFRDALGQTVTWEYASLEGGRVRFTMPNGGTQVFAAGLSGDTLTLTPEDAPGQVQRFVRLRNQTIAQAHQAEVERLTARQAALNDEVEDYFRAAKLVIASQEQGNTHSRDALDLVAGDFGGFVYTDGNPVLRRRTQVIFEDADLGEPIRVFVDFGEIVGPIGSGQVQPRRETFAVEGEPGSFRIVGGGRQIVAEAAAYDDLVRRFEAVEAERQAVVQAVRDALAVQAVLAGVKTPTGGAAQEVVAKPTRIGETDEYAGPINEGSRAQPAIGGITWDAGEGVLLLRAGNEVWRLALAPDGSLKGDFRAVNATQPAGTLALQVRKKWNAAELAALKAGIERYLTHDLRTPTDLTGFVAGRIANADGFWPVHLQVQTHPDGSATGQAWLLAQRGGVELRGNVQGALIVLHASSVLTSNADFRGFAQQQWRIEIDDMDPQPMLVGTLNMPTGGGGSLLLASATTEATEALRQHVLAALNDTVFELRSSRHTNRPDPETFLRLTADPAGNVTGELVGRDLDGAYAPAVINGSIKEERGHILLDLVFTTSINPTRGGRAGTVMPFTLVARLNKDEITFRGSTDQGIFGLFTALPTDHPYQPSDEHRIRLAAQRAGAIHALPNSVELGQTYVVLVQGTTRGHAYFGDGRYRAVNPAVAAVHAGLAADGEIALLRVTIAAPHDQAYPVGTQNGVTTQAVAMHTTTQRLMTMTLEKLDPASIR